ncbi:hypothetical protein K2173_027015 [Erythroxylum novogranatense]|uniref:X8 domain-containing protein n=1 Tax=Erythroxylum novogranatense TaxID=1862640 RepID=A0AAV8TY57_9ROSI|nr:hypothetical protein K2173_027015 [Erythroxylum novogranatense]
MAQVSTNSLYLFLLSLVTVCSTMVGFSHDAGVSAASSLPSTLQFFKLHKDFPCYDGVVIADHRILNIVRHSSLSKNLYLLEDQVGSLIYSESSAVSWLVSYVPYVRSIIVSGDDLSKLLSTLNLIHSAVTSLHLDNKIKVSVQFSTPLLQNLTKEEENDLHKILVFLKSIGSFVVLKASINTDIDLLQSMIQKVIAFSEVPAVIIIKRLNVPGTEVADNIADNVLEALRNSQFSGEMVGLYSQVSLANELKMEPLEVSSFSHRQLLNKLTKLHDAIDQATVFPTTPASTSPATPIPTVVTVPATNPVTITPTNPVTTPVPIPSADPIINPPTPITNPITSPAPVTIPGAQPITNPVTTYPAPTGNVPVTTPAIPGQSWCVARSGALQTAVQSALDYACGMGGADCSQIQQGGSCYNPNTLQDHASYAFNSFYQKHPVSTSCDFGGTAIILNVNPSTGSCIYPTSSSSSSLLTPSVPTPSVSSTNGATTSPTNPATTSPTNPLPGSGETGIGIPPSVLNSSSGTTTVFGPDTPPGINASASKSPTLLPFVRSVTIGATLVIGVVVLDMWEVCHLVH